MKRLLLSRGKSLPSVSLPRLNKNSKNSETGCDPDGEEEGVRRDEISSRKLCWWRGKDCVGTAAHLAETYWDRFAG
ncbi:hypothetical protein HPP92_006655 [Vanilla planifolia]|uniref:Uncharacterized protein n=1 Tax=Vanilla planifolia TaxID=51239 RepID=A0A835RF75_VANPL|nr:hypothetical protein HPP92_006655 [Vanilla planifolia]